MNTFALIVDNIGSINALLAVHILNVYIIINAYSVYADCKVWDILFSKDETKNIWITCRIVIPRLNRIGWQLYKLRYRLGILKNNIYVLTTCTIVTSGVIILKNKDVFYEVAWGV